MPIVKLCLFKDHPLPKCRKLQTNMNEENLKLAERFINKQYLSQGEQSLNSVKFLMKQLLYHRKLPKDGWTNTNIKMVLEEIALMDSNNFPSRVGVGEREGRCFSTIVAERNFNFIHGIGRSGDINEAQPKAAGSSLIQKLTNELLLDAFKVFGFTSSFSTLLVPVATGMAISLCFSTLRSERPTAKYIIWSRIDQKSCLKSIVHAGFIPVVVPQKQFGDELCTDIQSMITKITDIGEENILCICSTTSCFAPRVPDDLVSISKICAERKLPHIVNNAYGLQSSKCVHLLNEAHRMGRIDAFVQSVDKNFMAPVGGAVIASNSKCFIQKVSACYPGRASFAPVLDLFITLLSMGASGLRDLLNQRKAMKTLFAQKMTSVAQSCGERLLHTPHNDISMAMSIGSLPGCRNHDVTFLGSMLFKKFVSGARVVPRGVQKTVAGLEFSGFGSHCDGYFTDYLNFAAAIGITSADISLFVNRLTKCLQKFNSMSNANEPEDDD